MFTVSQLQISCMVSPVQKINVLFTVRLLQISYMGSPVQENQRNIPLPSNVDSLHGEPSIGKSTLYSPTVYCRYLTRGAQYRKINVIFTYRLLQIACMVSPVQENQRYIHLPSIVDSLHGEPSIENQRYIHIHRLRALYRVHGISTPSV